MHRALRGFICILAIMTLTSFFIGCDELISIWAGGGTGGGSITSYPMQTGNRWEYSRVFYTYNFRPIDPTYQFQSDSFRSRFTVVVARELNIPRIPGEGGDSIAVKELISTEAGQTVPGVSYYSQTSEGLLLQGYLGGSMILPTPRGEQYTITFVNRSFGSLRELIEHVEEASGPARLDSIRREYPPLMSIKYPLRTGNQWTFRPNGRPWRIDKQAGTQRRDPWLWLWYYDVQWLYDMNGDGIWDNNISVVDRISAKGLIRRTFDFRDLLITTSGNPNGVGYIDVRDESVLTSMNVQ